MKKLIALILLSAVCLMAGCKKTEDNPAMNVNITENGTVYDGSTQYFYEVKPGERAVAHISTEVISGSVSFDIHEKDAPDSHQYRGTVNESCGFDVIIEKAGEYRVLVTADRLTGSYGVEWRTEK